jgi:streptogramin lyase/tetratricopeptide (TPR) repeat protein
MGRICLLFVIYILFACLSDINGQNPGPEWEVFNSSNSGLPENKLKSITRDLNGNIWLGTAGDGGVRFDKHSQWLIYNEATSGISNNHVDSIAIDMNGNIWFGTGNGVCMFDGDTTWVVYNTENSGIINDDIYPVAIDRSQQTSSLSDNFPRVWIGTYGDGVVKFDGKTWENYRTGPNTQLKDNLIRSIAIDRKGNKWIGTLFGGLAKFNGDATWDVYMDFNSKLPNNAVYPIVFDSLNNIWVGTEGGIARFNGEKEWLAYNTENSGLPNNKVYSMKIDNSGIVWIGTVGGGLARFDPSVSPLAMISAGNDTTFKFPMTVYNTFNSGLPFNEIRGIHIDDEGIKWLATYGGGLAKFNENGVGWKNTGWDHLESFNPELDSIWSITNLVGMVDKYTIISKDQQDIVSAKLDQYMENNPNNTEALIQFTKIGLIKSTPLVILHNVIDKGLALEPQNARLNYWKGRLYGPDPPWDGASHESYKFSDYTKAVEYLGKAVEYNPENADFRKTLGTYYALNRLYEDARVHTKHVDNGNLPLYQLLRDIKTIPVPRDAVFLPQESLRMISVMKEKGMFYNYYNLRVHIYALPMSAVATGLFYEERLAKFEFFETERDKKAKSVKLRQYLKDWEMELYPANHLSEIPENPEEGVTIDVASFYRKLSYTNPTWVDEVLKISPSLENRKLFCKLVLVNYRDTDK